VIFDALIAAIIVHHKITIPNIFNINVHITHNDHHHSFSITDTNFVISSAVVLEIAQVIVKVRDHICILFHSTCTFQVCSHKGVANHFQVI